MSNIVSFSGSNLPSVATLSQALRSLEAEVGPSGVVILKCDKTGHWVFGSDQTEVEEGSKWAVNPFSFVHGFIAWGAGEVLGEKMVPITQPLPEMPDAPQGAKKGWEPQVGMALKCLNGEDKDMECRYSATSVGGKKAVQQLAVAIAGAVEKEQSKPVPVVTLDKDHYTHREFGRIYTPVFTVVDWVTMDGSEPAKAEAEPMTAEEEAAPAAAPAEEAPRRRRRVAEG
jgi:hypothetical protein